MRSLWARPSNPRSLLRMRYGELAHLDTLRRPEGCGPMGIVWGAANPVLRARFADDFVARLEPEVVDVVEHATYLVTWERPERVLAAIRRVDALATASQPTNAAAG